MTDDYWSAPGVSGSITAVKARDDGDWEVGFGQCFGTIVESSLCSVRPQVGELLESVGRFGESVRGIRIGGRVYRMRTVEEQRLYDLKQLHPAVLVQRIVELERQLSHAQHAMAESVERRTR